MNIGLIAHNAKKNLIEDFCVANKRILEKHEKIPNVCDRHIFSLHSRSPFCRPMTRDSAVAILVAIGML